MSNLIAPGVYVQDRDFSDYIAALGTTSVGMVGTAKRGPLNTPTLCTSPDQFLEIFGEPSVNHYGPHAGLNYLKKGNVLWYTRVAKLFVDDTATIVSIGSPDASGNIYDVTLGSGEGASFTTNDYVRITQTGKATTLAKVASIATDTLTLATPLNDTYSATSGSDSAVGLSTLSLGASESEVFGYTRTGGASSRVVHFKALNPGDWADFGSRNGIEVLIEDGGQYANVDPVTLLTVEDSEGNPLKGVVPSVPSKDTTAEIFALTSSDDVVVNELRGVNYSSVVTRVTNAVGDGSDLVLTVGSSTNFSVGDDITLSGFLTSLDFNGTHTITAITDATTIEVADPTAGETETPAADVVIAVNADSDHKGLVYRCTAVRATGSDWVVQGVLTKRVRVLYQGRQVEAWDNLIGYDATSELFWDTVIGTDAAPVSSYITAEYLGADGEQPINTYQRIKHPNNPRLLMGNDTVVKVTDTSGAGTSTFKNSNGVNGDNPASADYIGVVEESGNRTGLQAFRQDESYDINLLCCPGNSAASIVEEILAICTVRNDCLGIIDPPFGLSPQEVAEWHNGTGQWTGQHSAFTGSHGALYYPWVQQFDPYTSRNVWLPPSCFVPGVYTYSDEVGEVWYAPAGIRRGTVDNALAAEVVIQRGDIETFYGPGNGNAVNAISTFSRDGIVVNGQRTLQRFPSALDRVNVRRLLFFINKSISTTTRVLNFEQNDEVLWGEWLALVNPFLQQLQGQRALEWFAAVCDESTNTPARRNSNEMYAKIFLIPTKSAEKIIIDLTLFASGASVTELIADDNGPNFNT